MFRPSQRAMAALVYLREHTTLAKIAVGFGISESTAHAYATAVIHLLKAYQSVSGFFRCSGAAPGSVPGRSGGPAAHVHTRCRRVGGNGWGTGCVSLTGKWHSAPRQRASRPVSNSVEVGIETCVALEHEGAPACGRHGRRWRPAGNQCGPRAIADRYI